MTPLLALIPCPIALALAALSRLKSAALTRIGAALMWAELLVALYFWWPILIGKVAAQSRDGFRFDGTAAFFVLLTTLVVTASLTHAISFFDRVSHTGTAPNTDMPAHPPAPAHIAQVYVFVPLFLLAMVSIVCADNLGYLWIGMETTTLVSAPLVYYHRTRTSLEATWKYLIICSIGIAFGFLGTAILFAASQRVPTLTEGSLSLSVLVAHARELPPGLVRLGFVFILLGYGTKAGLFPLHNWLPDAHSEAPAPVSAILSGALLNCALVALWRITGLVEAAGQGALVQMTLLPMGIATTVAAALFLLKQRDIKRLLAYSSMENVGLMAVAISLNSGTGFLLQAINHSVVKVALFLVAGNLIQQFGTKTIRQLKGLLADSPAQGILLFLLIAAVAGTPPFGSFLSEWSILTTAADRGHIATVVLLVAALALAFIALSIQVGDMLFGSAGQKPDNDSRGSRVNLSVPSVLFVASLCLGLQLTPSVLAIAVRGAQ